MPRVSRVVRIEDRGIFDFNDGLSGKRSHSVSLILGAVRRKHGIHLGPDCDASCGSNLVCLLDWPNEKKAGTLGYTRGKQSGGYSAKRTHSKSSL